MDNIIKCFIIFLGGKIGAILGPLFCWLLICCFGFTPIGIRAGSEAARLMQEDGTILMKEDWYRAYKVLVLLDLVLLVLF